MTEPAKVMVSTYLTPDEIRLLDAEAAKEFRSRSSQIKLLILRGIQEANS